MPFTAVRLTDRFWAPRVETARTASPNIRTQRWMRTLMHSSRESGPLVEQREAVGHAFRAGYLYTEMADVPRLRVVGGITERFFVPARVIQSMC